MNKFTSSRWLTLLLIGGTAVFITIMLLSTQSTAATGHVNLPDGTSRPLSIAMPLTTTTPSATPTFTEANFLPVVLNQYPPTPTPTSTPTSSGCLPDPPLDASDSGVDTAVYNNINQERSNNSLPAYTLNDQLTQAARRHSYDMAQNNVTSHTGSDGSSPSQRINEACYNTTATGEIIGWGFSTVDAMMSWWMNSTPHRSLILHTTLEEIGVAYVNAPGSAYTHYWTVTFGKAAATSANHNLPQYICTQRIEEATRGISAIWTQAEPCEK
ncbi:MAG: CAP domain-containing protein [Anaerolineales bacterium]|nr:CAP domain-containing protein [Anaerolineales bacterium]